MVMLYLVLAMTSLAMLTGCSAHKDGRSGYDLCNRGVHRTPDGTVRICERITDQSVASVKDILTENDKEIILTSGGGSTAAAMELGRLLNRQGITIRVRQFCLSACSTYVLLPASKIVVEPYAIIAFHYTGAFNLETIGARAGMEGDDPRLEPAKAERAYFSEFELDPELLDQFSQAIQPSCMGMRRSSSGNLERYINYTYSWFIPTEAEIDQLLGTRRSGYWPASLPEAEGILRPTLGDPSARIILGWPERRHLSPAEVAQTLPRCEDSLDNG